MGSELSSDKRQGETKLEDQKKKRRKRCKELFLKKRRKVEEKNHGKQKGVWKEGGSRNRQVGTAGSLRPQDLRPVPRQEMTSPRKGAQGRRAYASLAASVHPRGPGAVRWVVPTCASPFPILPKGLSPGDPA